MLYLEIARFKFMRFFAYPWEIVAMLAKRVVGLTFLIYFWSLVLGSSSDTTLLEITSYFLIAFGVGDLVMARWGGLGSSLGNSIKYGRLSQYMVKPVSLIPNLYAVTIGRTGMRMVLAVVYLIAGIAINPPTSLISVLLFFCFFVFAFIVAFSYNLLIGTIYFHIGDASGIKNSITHMSRILSGALVPIHFFPDGVEKIIRITPFPIAIYGPTNAITIDKIDKMVVNDIIVGVFWAVFLPIAAYFAWTYSIKRYEAVGI